jgi:hypothetical protein
LPWDPDQPIAAEQAQQRCREIGLPPTADWRRVWTPEPIGQESIAWCAQRPDYPPPGEVAMWVHRFGETQTDRLHRRHAGWRMEFFGVHLHPPEEGDMVPRVLLATPRFLLSDDSDTPVISLIIHHGIAWREGSAVSTEMRFGRWGESWPDDRWPGERWITSGFSWPTTDEEWNEARQGMKLLQHVASGQGGRQHGWRKGREWKRRMYLEWYESRLDDREPTLKDLGIATGVSADTARRRLGDLKPPLPWPPRKHPKSWRLR